MKKNKVRYCKQYGLQWHGFKVPRGAIYGHISGRPFIVTKFPEIREHATRLFIWTYLERRKKWVEHSASKYFDLQVELCHGDYHETIWHNHVAATALAYLKKYPDLRIEGFRPPLCHTYMNMVTPREKRPQKYIPRKECFSQRCVDGKGYKPSEDTRKNGDINEYAGAMKESFVTLYPSYWENNYWNLKGLV